MTTDEMLDLIRQGHVFTNEEWKEIRETTKEKQSETTQKNKSFC
jgi:hypothetical protein